MGIEGTDELDVGHYVMLEPLIEIAVGIKVGAERGKVLPIGRTTISNCVLQIWRKNLKALLLEPGFHRGLDLGTISKNSNPVNEFLSSLECFLSRY